MYVVRLDIAYDGTEFRGWARQRDQRTVQGVLDEALERVLQVPRPLSVAGRTDAGVHARGQVASFSTEAEMDLRRLQRAVNGLLAPEVVVRDARAAPPGFDARRSATAREYRYRIATDDVPDPFTARFTWHRPGDLSIGRMRLAARSLSGEHDFRSFCRSPGEARSTVRTLGRLSVSRRASRVEISVRANSFLHQMVRSLVGTLVAVGEGGLEPDAMEAILAAGSRSAAGPVAPAHGLTLERVLYGRGPLRPGLNRPSRATPR
ncbi:MAG: tRNA pseudouridine(38-40) synthase TruA [Actinomycetota bacterium]|nr:tRNA pseudouridine(38-40) synthase TruA [Actinomycetota bacterium]